jgi:hypothetical protein
VERAYNAFFWDSGTELAVVNGRRRTSLIVDPPDGLIPALTADAQKKVGNPRPAWGSAVTGPDDPENARRSVCTISELSGVLRGRSLGLD